MNPLLRFTVENYKSIAGRKTILFTPRKITDEPKTNVVSNGRIKYLRTCAVYGANSSGKSNLIGAMAQMKNLVRGSVRLNDDDPLDYTPFILDEDSFLRPTLFEVEFSIEGNIYRYGFSHNAVEICEEWFYMIKKTAEKPFFIRNADGIGIDEKLFPEGHNLEEKTNGNRLFISLVGQNGGKLSNMVLSFFRNGLNFISGLNTEPLDFYSQKSIQKDEGVSNRINNFFDKVKLGFQNILIEEVSFDPVSLPSDMPEPLRDKMLSMLEGKKTLKTSSEHNVYNGKGEIVGRSTFDFDRMESSGTKKLFELSGPIFDTLERGAVIVIDELDAKMHPLLSQELIALFNNPESNPLGAQLVFSTHDTHLLSSHLLRRDQVWFTEKDAHERTDLYNLMQIVLPDGTTPRGDGNLERNYIQGRYGAIPYIG